MKRARKVALISVYDYPRNDYSAYWSIDVQGSDEEGYRWAAHLFAYEPVGWDYQGAVTAKRPDVPLPEYPVDLSKLPKDATPKQIADDVIAQEARRQLCSKIYEANPKPVYLIEETVGVTKTRDEADTAAQQWVLDRIEQFCRTAPLVPLTDDDIEVKIAQFDRARRRKEFGVCDKLRGELKSAGVEIGESEKISYEGRTGWKRKGGVNKQSGHALVLGPIDLVFEGVRAMLERLFRGLAFALAFSTTMRNERVQRIQVNIDLGAGAGLWRIYDGSRPATCGTATTLLAELTFTDPAAPAASGGVLTFSAITADAAANATGTATWARAVDSTGTCCVDMNVGTSGSDLNLNSTSISTGQQVSITSAVVTEGNA
jgi:hypothetical protein